MWWINRNDPACLKHLGKHEKRLFIEAEDLYYSASNVFTPWVGNGLVAYYAGLGDKRVLAGVGDGL